MCLCISLFGRLFCEVSPSWGTWCTWGRAWAYLSCSVAISGFTPQHGAHGAHAKIIELPSKLDPGNAGNVFLNLGHRNGAVPELPAVGFRGEEKESDLLISEKVPE